MIEVTAAIIRRGDQVLICQRPKGKSCELLWEFPGGKIEADETGELSIVRECREELGVDIRVIKKLTDVSYEYTDKIVHLHFYISEILSGDLTRKEHHAFAWITPDEVRNYTFCPADATMLAGACWAHEFEKQKGGAFNV